MAKAPTRKQLAARKKFVKMVRARARAMRAAKRKNPRFTAKQDRQARAIAKSYVKRGASAKRARSIGYATVSVRKNGRKLYGAAAQAVLASRAKKNPRSEAQKKYRAARKYHSKAVARGLVKYAKAGASRPAASPRRNQTVTARHADVFVHNGSRGLARSSRRMAKAKRGLMSGKVSVSAWRKESKRTAKAYGRSLKRQNNGIFRTAARRAISRRLHAPIRFGRRRRNPNTPEGIAEIHQTFLGRPTEGHFEIVAPAGTPKDVAVLGSLVCLKTEEEDFEFDKGEAYLGADERGNLYVLGDTTPVETNTNFGEIEEIRYEAKKDHLNPFHWRRRKGRRNPNTIEYYHYFGEEDGKMPKLKSDDDGLLHISGGNYRVEAEGIIN